MLKGFEIFEERIASNSKAKTGRGTALNNASHDKIQEIAETFGNINGNVEIEESLKKMQNPSGKP